MKIFKLVVFIAFGFLAACGGGSEQNGMLIEGQLEQGEAVEHVANLIAKHSAGEMIGHVEICALGQCSTTDSEGQWGFIADPSFTGGEVLFSVEGHGINSTFTAHIPHGAQEVFLHLMNSGGIEIHHFMVDGESVESDHDHGHEG